jgi:Flp pilus assembly protein TadG
MSAVIAAKRGFPGEAGSSLVEMALALNVVLILTFGIFQMSLAFYTQHCISDLAREGSRYAIVRGSTSCSNTPTLTNCNASSAQIQTYVKSIRFPGVDSGQPMTVFPTWLAASATTPTTWSNCTVAPCNTPGSLASVQVTYAFPLSIPFWRSTVLNLQSTSQMVIAQ